MERVCSNLVSLLLSVRSTVKDKCISLQYKVSIFVHYCYVLQYRVTDPRTTVTKNVCDFYGKIYANIGVLLAYYIYADICVKYAENKFYSFEPRVFRKEPCSIQKWPAWDKVRLTFR